MDGIYFGKTREDWHLIYKLYKCENPHSEPSTLVHLRMFWDKIQDGSPKSYIDIGMKMALAKEVDCNIVNDFIIDIIDWEAKMRSGLGR